MNNFIQVIKFSCWHVRVLTLVAHFMMKFGVKTGNRLQPLTFMMLHMYIFVHIGEGALDYLASTSYI